MNTAAARPLVQAGGTGIEMTRAGGGRPLLFLHPHIGLHGAQPFIEQLAARAEVLAPSHPGFGASELPAHLTSVDDLAYFYLDVLEDLDLRGVTLVGSSFGAWIALEIATKNLSRIERLVLIGAQGVKFGPRERSDVVDIFSTPRARLEELSYEDAAFSQRDTASLSEEEMEVMARNWETTARFAWTPYMHNPKLRGRLHRIKVPTLVLWGARDRIAPAEYGRRYAQAIPAARFEEVAASGHYPHIEQPQAAARLVLEFMAKAAR